MCVCVCVRVGTGERRTERGRETKKKRSPSPSLLLFLLPLLSLSLSLSLSPSPPVDLQCSRSSAPLRLLRPLSAAVAPLRRDKNVHRSGAREGESKGKRPPRRPAVCRGSAKSRAERGRGARRRRRREEGGGRRRRRRKETVSKREGV